MIPAPFCNTPNRPIRIMSCVVTLNDPANQKHMKEHRKADAAIAGNIGTSRFRRSKTEKLAMQRVINSARLLPNIEPPKKPEPTSMIKTPTIATAAAIIVEREGFSPIVA